MIDRPSTFDDALPGHVERRADRLLPGARDLLSLEFLFAAFLFSGRFKLLPELSFIPFDLTAFMFILTGAAFVGSFLRGTVEVRFTPVEFVFALLSVLVLLSITWSSFGYLNIDKLIRYVVFTMPAFFIGSTLGRQPERVGRFVRVMVLISIVLVSYYMYYRIVLNINLTADTLAVFYANNYLAYSAHASYLFSVFSIYLVFAGRPKVMIGYVGVFSWLFGLVLIGGRGPMLFGLMSIPLILLTSLLRQSGFAGRTKRFLVLVGALVTVIGYCAVLASGGNTLFGEELVTIERWEWSFSGESTSSMDVREEAQMAAIRFWEERPFFGWGFGEFRVRHWLEYPHNLLFEVLMELGLAGAVLFVSLCALVAGRSVRILANPSMCWTSVAVVILTLCELASHLTVQGYLADDRAFCAFLGLVAGLSRWARRHRRRNFVASQDFKEHACVRYPCRTAALDPGHGTR